MSGALRIVRLANFVTPASGGLRTALAELGKGYRAAGHEPVLVIPGAYEKDELTDQGRVITLPGPVLPGTGGYRVLADRQRVRAVLEGLAPDRIEVSDRTTLRWTGEWARRSRVPSVMVSHETADGVLRTWGCPGVLPRGPRTGSTAVVRGRIRGSCARRSGPSASSYGSGRATSCGRRSVLTWSSGGRGGGAPCCAPGMCGAVPCCSSCARGSPSRSGRAPPWTHWPCCGGAGCGPRSWWPGTGRCAGRWSAGPVPSGCPRCSWGMWATGTSWRICRPPRTSRWHPGPPRPSDSRRWRRWPAARRSSRARRRRFPRWWGTRGCPPRTPDAASPVPYRNCCGGTRGAPQGGAGAGVALRVAGVGGRLSGGS